MFYTTYKGITIFFLYPRIFWSTPAALLIILLDITNGAQKSQGI